MTEIAFTLPDNVFEALAQRAAEIYAQRDDGYLDLKAAAAYTGKTDKAISRAVETGKLVPHRGSGRWAFKRSQLDAWMQG